MHRLTPLLHGNWQICVTLHKIGCNFWPARSTENAQVYRILIFFISLRDHTKNRKKNYRRVIGDIWGVIFGQFYKNGTYIKKEIEFGVTFQISAQLVHYCAGDGISKKIDHSFWDSQWDLGYSSKFP